MEYAIALSPHSDSRWTTRQLISSTIYLTVVPPSFQLRKFDAFHQPVRLAVTRWGLPTWNRTPSSARAVWA
jgi:hypothetical protein